MDQKSGLVKVFGESSRIRVVDFFLDNYLFDYSKSDVAKAIDLSRSTVHKQVDKLEELDVLEFHRKVGRAKMYRFNREHPIAQKLMELEDVILTEMEKDIRETPIKA